MRPRREGASALIVALSISTLGGFLALVVDLGVTRFLREELQAGTDAAALSAARRLDGSATSVALARATAVDVGHVNTAMGVALELDPNASNAADGDVVLGSWDETTSMFQPETDPTKVDAVEVRTRREDLATWFAVFVGRDELAAAAVSIAARGREVGAGRVPYYLPFALPLCQVDGRTEQQILDMTFVLSPASGDVVGWGAVEANPSASWVRDHIAGMLACMHEFEDTGTVSEACAQIGVDDTVNLGNGAQASSLTYLSNAMSQGIEWDTERWGALPPQHAQSSVPKKAYGTVLEGPIPIFSGGSGYCTAGASWNETLPIEGFVWGVIYDVASKGSAAQRNVWIRLDVSTVYDIGEWSGGGNWGVVAFAPPVLVW